MSVIDDLIHDAHAALERIKDVFEQELERLRALPSSAAATDSGGSAVASDVGVSENANSEAAATADPAAPAGVNEAQQDYPAAAATTEAAAPADVGSSPAAPQPDSNQQPDTSGL